jgi:sec-independent protein translocase protein TatA
MFRNIGTTEIIIIAVVLLILFGGKKLPELGRGIGDAIKEFKKALSSGKDSSSK